MKKEEVAAVWESIDNLVPWDQNPRLNDHSVDKVANSIKRFGFGAPIVARREDKMVIAGHTRLKAAKQLGLDAVPVRYLDLDPADAKMLALADNKIGEIADWDNDELDRIINDLALSAEDMEDLGWNQSDLDGFFEPVFDSQEEPKEEIDIKDLDLCGEVMYGDCMEKLKELPSNSIDAIVTDPPYGMSPDGIARTWADIEEGRNLSGFMGKEWDAAVPCHNFFAECFRVLKHGGHMIAFSSTRTVCALGMAAQKGGFHIRDMLHWCYFSGFPKSHDISKAIDKDAGAVREVVGIDRRYNEPSGIVGVGQGERTLIDRKITKPATQDAQKWAGFGTALKPAVEPALLLRKPLEDGLTIAQNVLKHGTGALNIDDCRFGYGDPCWVGPQDVVQDQSDSYRGASSGLGLVMKDQKNNPPSNIGRWPANLYQCAKPSTKEREQGLDHLHKKISDGYMGSGETRLDGNPNPKRANFHPTVKPLKLMQWCCRLIGGQKGSVILDPFGGSGTTGAAAILEGFDCILMEQQKEYLPIIDARLKWAKQQVKKGGIDG
ncbi:MAG: DNA modification methylase [Pseudomonadota bacterium]|nr:DNA modification methylase [Pseudomonadota bacterium]